MEISNSNGYRPELLFLGYFADMQKQAASFLCGALTS